MQSAGSDDDASAGSDDGDDDDSSPSSSDASGSGVIDGTTKALERMFVEEHGIVWPMADLLDEFGGADYSAVTLGEVVGFWSLIGQPDLLSVGSPLQPSPAEEHYKFIAALYTEARCCLDGDDEDEGDDYEEGAQVAVWAKAFCLTAGLFEQCRVSDTREVTSLFDPRNNSNGEGPSEAVLGRTLPFCHSAVVGTRTRAGMKQYVDNLDLKQREQDLLLREPRIKLRVLNRCARVDAGINYREIRSSAHHHEELNADQSAYNGDDVCGNGANHPAGQHTGQEWKTVGVNPLTLCKYLLLPSGEKCVGDTLLESLRVVVNCHDGALRCVLYPPFCKDHTLAEIGVQDGDSIVIEERESPDPSWHPIDTHYLEVVNVGSNNQCWMEWVDETLNTLCIGTKSTDRERVLRYVANFWSEKGTGRSIFMSADTQMFDSFLCEGGRDGVIEKVFNKAMLIDSPQCTSMSCLMTAGLIYQGQFTDIIELLAFYSDEGKAVDEERMKEMHPWLYAMYSFMKTPQDILQLLKRTDLRFPRGAVTNQAICLRLQFYDCACNRLDSKTVNPLITLETLVGFYASESTFCYQSIRITIDDGRVIDFRESRRKSLRELELMDQSVLNVEDATLHPTTYLPKQSPRNHEEFAQSFIGIINAFAASVTAEMKVGPGYAFEQDGTERTRMSLKVLALINMHFIRDKYNMRCILSPDQMDTFERYIPYTDINANIMSLMTKGSFFEAKVKILALAFVEQCQTHGIESVLEFFRNALFAHDTTGSTLEQYMPVFHRYSNVLESEHTLQKHLECFDAYQHGNELRRTMQPRIYLVFLNRMNGKENLSMASANVHTTLGHYLKDRVRKGKTLVTYNGSRVFLSSWGKKSLMELGIKDGDTFVADTTVDDEPITTLHTNNNDQGQKRRKKSKARAKQKNKPREQIVVPKTEGEHRKDHSTMLSPVLEEMEREKLRGIRKKLNDLSIRKTAVKECKPSVQKKDRANDEPWLDAPAEGLEGKAGRVFFPVIVGDTEHLYRSSKKSKVPQNQMIITIDLHGLTAEEATSKLDDGLPALVDAAMKEEAFTIPVDIICGGGGQVLAEVVEQWIRKTRQVANQPKGF